MSKVDDMRKLKEDIIASYDARVATVGEIISNVHEIANGTRSMLGRFHQERQETVNELKEMSNELKERSNELKENLAQNESTRLSVFGALFDDIQTLLNNIVTLQGGRKVEVAKILSEAKASRIENFGELMNEVQSKLNNIRTRQKEREEEVSSLLETFDKEQQEMANALNEAFEQARASRLEAEVARLQEISAFLDTVREKRNARENEVKSIQNEVKSLLNSYAEEREGMAAAWRSLSEIIQQRKAGVSIEVPPVVEEEVSPTEPAVPEVEELPAEETAPVAEEEVPPTEVAAPEVEELPVEETAPAEEEEALPSRATSPVVEVALPVEDEAIPVEEEVSEEETASAEGDREELQNQMLSLINSHADGLKLVDLGEELGVPWRSLVLLARNLVESGQVTKVDVFYYPADSGLDLQVVMAESETKEVEESEEE